MSEVRDEFARTTKAVSLTRKALARIAGATATKSAALELRNRVLEVDFSVPLAIDTVETALGALTAVEQSIRSALQRLPRKSRKGGAANPWPIQRIEKALLDGFIKHHCEPFPAYDIVTSRNKPPFRDIVAICYEAMGLLDTADGGKLPDRAIREYLRLKKLRRLDTNP